MPLEVRASHERWNERPCICMLVKNGKNLEKHRLLFLIMKKLFLTLLVSLFVGIATNAQSQNQSQINDAIWLKIGSDTNLTFNEITKSGSFAGCEVVYRYVYRDYRSRNGEPVILIGSISSNYVKGVAVFGLFLKVQARVFDLSGKDVQIKSIQPHFATMVTGKSNLDKYRITKFTCENGGYCAAYASADAKFIKTVFSQIPFNPEILFTLSPDGMDSKLLYISINSTGIIWG